MCQSPSRGTGISTNEKGMREMEEHCVNPLPGEPAFLPVEQQEEAPAKQLCQSPSRGTGISTLLSQDALPERLPEVKIYRDCTFLYFPSKITGYFVKIRSTFSKLSTGLRFISPTTLPYQCKNATK